MRTKRRESEKAFTLIEMLLVIVIIGILAGAVAVGLSGRSQQARMTRARADMEGSLALAIDMFEQDIGRYPTSDEGLAALVAGATSEAIEGWHGPYVKGGLRADPWGTDYAYALSDTNNTYTLTSAGPDRTAGTADDISVSR